MNPDVETLVMIRDSAEKLLQPDTAVVRRLRDERSGFDDALWTTFAEMGWLGILAPEDIGGSGFGAGAATVIAERLGYGARAEPFSAVAVLAVRALSCCPQSPRRDEILSAVTNGAALAAIGWQPWSGALSAEATPLTASRTASGIHVKGKCFHVLVPEAEYVLVAARSEVGVGLFELPRDTLADPGLEVAADGTSVGSFSIDAVIPYAALISGPDCASRMLDDAIDLAAICAAAEIFGIVEKAQSLTRDYVCVREQFGRSIGSFQSIQHQLVDVWIQVRLLRAALKSAVLAFEAVGSTREQRAAAASSAKARASHVALFAAGRCIQMHGAIGMTDEYDLGVYVNRALVLAGQFGNLPAHRRRYGSLVRVGEREA